MTQIRPLQTCKAIIIAFMNNHKKSYAVYLHFDDTVDDVEIKS